MALIRARVCGHSGSGWGRVWLVAFLILLAAGTATAQESTAPAEEEPDYNAMASLLENEASRNRLIAELRSMAEEGGAEPEAGGVLEGGVDLSLEGPVELVSETRDLVEGFSEEVADAASAVASIDFSERSGTFGEFLAASFRLGVAAIVAILIYTLLHKLSGGLCDRVANWATRGRAWARVLRQLVGVLGPLLVRLAAIGIAWLVAYGVALYLIPPRMEIAREVAVFLNAFLIVEPIRVVVQSVLSPTYPQLRILPVETSSACYWNRWLGWGIGFVGYGLLVAYPLVNESFSPALAQLLALVVMLLAYITLVVLVLQNRSRGRLRLQRAARTAGMVLTRVLVGLLARVWHILAILYFTALVLVAINDPDEGLPLMAQATLQSVVAIALGALLSSILTRLIGRRVTLPGSLSHWSPALERQLSRYVPAAMKVIRVIITLVVLAVVLDAWTGFDLGSWAESETGAWLLESLSTVAVIVTLSVLVWIFAASWIEKRLNEEGPSTAASARQKTLLSLFRNALAIVILVVTLMIVLSELGINIAPLLASAGVLGLAIGFGAQKLVQDIITGVFIQLENAINTGDVVTVAGYSGVAERVSIRSLGLRDLSGTYHIIPFSSVDTVSNFMREYGFHLGEYVVSFRENTDDVLDHMRAAFEELKQNPEHKDAILEDLEISGVTQFGDKGVTLRVRIKTLPGLQWGVGREYNRILKHHFDAAGIEIPYPHTTLLFGRDKEGNAPPAAVKVLDRNGEVSSQQEPEADAESKVDKGDADNRGDR